MPSKPKMEPDSVHAKSRLINQFHFDASQEAIRATFLASGGALLAMLTYLGNVGKTSSMMPDQTWLSVALVGFGVGLVISLWAFVQMWRHQEEVDFHPEGPWKLSNSAIRRSLYFSVFFFLLGVMGAGVAIATTSRIALPPVTGGEQGPTSSNAAVPDAPQ